MESKLSRGIIPKLFNSHVPPGTSFTFQVSSMREMKGGAVNGFRLKINDGQFENQYVMYNGPVLAELQINSIVTGISFFSTSHIETRFSNQVGSKFGWRSKNRFEYFECKNFAHRGSSRIEARQPDSVENGRPGSWWNFETNW